MPLGALIPQLAMSSSFSRSTGRSAYLRTLRRAMMVLMTGLAASVSPVVVGVSAADVHPVRMAVAARRVRGADRSFMRIG